MIQQYNFIITLAKRRTRHIKTLDTSKAPH
jgi:hypothetical protein